MYEIQNNILSIAIALILFFSLKTQMNRKIVINKNFFYILWITVSLLVIESILVILSNREGELIHTVLNISAVVYFSLSAINIAFCGLYIEQESTKITFKLKKSYIVYIVMTLVIIVLSLLSINNHILFEITNDNQFSINLHTIIYIFIAYLVIGTFVDFGIKDLKHVKKKEIVPWLLFSLLPVIAFLLLLISGNYGLIWNTIIVSLLISYVYVQMRITSTDFLTGLFNRREFQFKLDKIKGSSNKNEKVFGIIIDLDDFKKINDKYGHQEGDLALVEAGQILNQSVRKHDFVSRIGGDEFAIILSARNEADVMQVIDRINENLSLFNERTNNKYNLRFSFGFDYYDESKYKTVLEFFNHIDTKMYINKREER